MLYTRGHLCDRGGRDRERHYVLSCRSATIRNNTTNSTARMLQTNIDCCNGSEPRAERGRALSFAAIQFLEVVGVVEEEPLNYHRLRLHIFGQADSKITQARLALKVDLRHLQMRLFLKASLRCWFISLSHVFEPMAIGVWHTICCHTPDIVGKVMLGSCFFISLIFSSTHSIVRSQTDISS